MPSRPNRGTRPLPRLQPGTFGTARGRPTGRSARWSSSDAGRPVQAGWPWQHSHRLSVSVGCNVTAIQAVHSGEQVAHSMRSGIRAVVVVVLVLAAIAPASGQTLLDGGMKVAAQSERIAVRVVVTDRDPRCTVSRQVVEAEAERTLRRDGLSVGDSATVLVIDVIVTLTEQRDGLFTGCVASLSVQLLVVLSAESQVVLLAGRSSNLAVGGRDRAHVDLIRSAVEEDVSVFANAIRRVRDEAQR